jgi:hypothetical protein
MPGNPTQDRRSTEPPLLGGGRESVYANISITKAPGWYCNIALDALLNGIATGLFVAAAVSELTLPVVFGPVAKTTAP